MPNTIYWDNNASTNVSLPVIEAMRPWVDGSLYGNPHAGHDMGKTSRDAIHLARENVLSVFGLAGSPEWRCVFTSGATESNNLAIKGVVFHNRSPLSEFTNRPPLTIITTPVEHASVDNILVWLRDLFQEMVCVVVLPVDEHGVVDLVEADRTLSNIDNAVLFTCIHVVAETGACQPVAALAKLVKSKFPSIVVHTDASQSVGKLCNNVLSEVAEHVDLITVAGHKFHGPKGVGALIIRSGTSLTPLIHGAGQEFGLRGGTENVANIVGLGAACAEVVNSNDPIDCAMIDFLIACIHTEFAKRNLNNYKINSTAKCRSAYTVNLSVAGLDGPGLVRALAKNKICISAGSACHSRGPPAPSKVLAAMGMDSEYTTSGIRLSISKFTKHEEISHTVSEIVSHICDQPGATGCAMMTY